MAASGVSLSAVFLSCARPRVRAQLDDVAPRKLINSRHAQVSIGPADQFATRSVPNDATSGSRIGQRCNELRGSSVILVCDHAVPPWRRIELRASGVGEVYVLAGGVRPGAGGPADPQ